jgi:cytochrome c-type biogenesis protein CcmH/NrfF
VPLLRVRQIVAVPRAVTATYDEGMMARLLVASMFAALLMAAPARAATQTIVLQPSADATALFHRVMSPYCPGLLLADCPSPDAGILRRQITARIKQGENAGDIERELYRTFGDELRTMPAAEGFGLSAWLIPWIVFAVATVLVIVAIRRTQRRPSETSLAAAASSIAISPELLDRIDDELSEIR